LRRWVEIIAVEVAALPLAHLPGSSIGTRVRVGGDIAW
jgi:hypothetical protein